MATELTSNTSTLGHFGFVTWLVDFDSTTDVTDSIVIDLSAQNYTNSIKVLEVEIVATNGLGVRLEFDEGGGDTLVAFHPAGAAGVVRQTYYDLPSGGLVGTGDIVATTTAGANTYGANVNIKYWVD